MYIKLHIIPCRHIVFAIVDTVVAIVAIEPNLAVGQLPIVLLYIQ